MTVETRTFIELADILGLEFICSECKAVVIRPLPTLQHLPYACGNCRKEWMGESGKPALAIKQLAGYLEDLAGLEAELPFKVRLQVAYGAPE